MSMKIERSERGREGREEVGRGREGREEGGREEGRRGVCGTAKFVCVNSFFIKHCTGLLVI